MIPNSNKSKQIAKNTMLLYFRLFVNMGIALYTSRVVLDVLGEIDYGIYGVVAGTVIMISVLNNSLTITTQRFINYEKGCDNDSNLTEVFSTALICHYLIALAILVFAETAGLWFVKEKLVIPPDREYAAVMIYHFAVIAVIFNIIGTPYIAAIIAHEKMGIYAALSILQSVLTLIFVLLLLYLPGDKLIVYGLMMMLVAIIIRFIYILICKRAVPSCKFKFTWNKDLLARMFGFSGWMVSGTVSHMLSNQGVNILINIYFGPLLNAARRIAVEVHTAIFSFVGNLITAVKPQIIQSYASNDIPYMNRLVMSSSKVTFYMVFIIILPIIINVDFILALWLKEVPEYSALFTKLILFDLLIASSYQPLALISQASGKIRNYQLIVTVTYTLIFLLTWILYHLGYPAHITFIVAIIINGLGLFARLYEMKLTLSFPMSKYLKQVTLPVSIIFTGGLITAFLITHFCNNATPLSRIVNALIYCGVTLILVCILGLDKSEKNFLKTFFMRFKHKITK